MADFPWSKFFWADWEADQSLRLCSLAAQGLWMRMLCVCARSEPYGYLAINDRGLDVSDIARLAGVTPTEASDLVDELGRNGVFSRDRKGRIYSRRLIRDKKKSDEGRKHVKNRWGQAAEKKGENPQPNRVPNRVPNRIPSTKKPEARSQTEVVSNDTTARDARSAFDFLSQVIGDELARDFISHRKAMRKPMTPRAGQILAAKLATMRDPASATITAIERGWQSVFEDDRPNRRNGGTSYAERLDDTFDALTARLADQPFVAGDQRGTRDPGGPASNSESPTRPPLALLDRRR